MKQLYFDHRDLLDRAAALDVATPIEAVVYAEDTDEVISLEDDDEV